ncbi:D-2-hydroxyacid dehydrogenase family protein [Salinisphaera aquimarina]|uniref:D-2-hydroxyacid dehydrogenase family protein n=1 Tax=Salinisphaera aquimarina TaxID=2094031 RepID=A0ABV7EML2_9GAMM
MRIALLDDYQDVARELAPWERLPADAQMEVFHDHVADEDALVERLLPFDVLGVMRERTPLPRSLIERLPNLRLIVTTGKSNAAIDVAAAREQGICVCGTESLGYATAEHTMGLMLALARNLVTEANSVAAGGWQVGLGRDLRGATLGLAGLGRLGAEVAQLGHAFGMRVIAWSENLSADQAAAQQVEAVSKQTLLRQADYLSIHLRLSKRTRGLFGAPEFALMQPQACLINTSRAPIIDTDALLQALDAGRPAAAALDVFETEPLPADSPLRDHPKLLLTPHIGYVTRPTYEVFYEGTLEAILAFAAGAPIHELKA